MLKLKRRKKKQWKLELKKQTLERKNYLNLDNLL